MRLHLTVRSRTKAKTLASNSTRGFNTKRTLQDNPEIARMYELYLSCREQHVVTYQSSKGKDTVQHLKAFTTGFAQLPEAGGVLDQSHRIMTFLEAFLAGDRHGFAQEAR